MKKTQLIELFKNIKKTAVSFVAITMFVTLAVGLFSGITSASDAVLINMHEELEKGNAYDIAISYPYGFTDADLETLKSVDGVDEIEGTYTASAVLEQNGENVLVNIKMANRNISTLYDVEGTLPSKEGEIAVEAERAEALGIGIGDTLTFTPSDNDDMQRLVSIMKFNPETDDVSDFMDANGIGSEFDEDFDMDELDEYLDEDESNEDADPAIEDAVQEDPAGEDVAVDDASADPNGTEENHDSLTTDTFTVTALVHSPEYISNNVLSYGVTQTTLMDVDCVMFVDESSFNRDAFPGYTQVYIRSDSLRGMNSFGDAYKEQISALEDRLEKTLESVTEARYAFVKSQVDALMDAADAKLDEIDAKLTKANDTLDYIDYELSLARDKLVVGEAEAAILGEAVSAVRQKELAVVGKYQQVENEHIDDNIVTYFAFNLADKKVAELDAKVQNLMGTAAYVNGLVKSGRAKYNEAVLEVADGREKLEEGREYYDQAVAEYENYKTQATDLQEYDSTILDRTLNPSVSLGVSLSRLLLKLRYTMAMLFLIVGVLVCFSSISRIINDQMVSIGTKKALGLSQSEITLSYLIYTMLAAVLGIVTGLATGVLIEYIMLSVFKDNFVMDSMAITVEMPGTVVLVCIAEIVIIALVTYMACAKILKKPAVVLLKGPMPEGGRKRLYEYMGFWSKLSLLSQTIINNCANDGRRVFATLIGVAGCTSLIVTAFTMNDNIFGSINVQYEKYYNYDTMIYFSEDTESDENVEGDEDSEEVGATAAEQIGDILVDYDAPNTLVTSYKYIIKLPDGTMNYAGVYVPHDLETFIELVTEESNDDGNYNDPYGGVWMSDAYDNYYGTGANTKIWLMGTDGDTSLINLDGFFNSHIQGYQIVMSEEKYEQYFGTEAEPNCYLVDTDALSEDELRTLEQRLKKVDGYLLTKDQQAFYLDAYSVFKSLSIALVAVYLGLSVVMSLLVLLNLFDLFVNEKKKELIVLMINGFSIHDAKRYIYSDTIALTVIGTILGVWLGNFVGYISVRASEVANTRFLHGIDWKADLIGVVGSFALSALISWISLKKIEKFKLRDINEL